MSGTRRRAGRLWPQVVGYRAWLEQRGYTPGTVRNMLKDLGQVGLWLSVESIELAQLDEARIAAFLLARHVTGHRHVPGPRGMVPLLSYLREMGLAPAAVPSIAPLDVFLGQYRCWMVQERNLAAATVLRYENTARRFLSEQASHDGVFGPAGLTGADVNAFLLRECARVSAGSAKGRVAELRSILRFLYLQGITPLRLGTAVPPVGGWRLASLPPTMAPGDIQLLLDRCDRSSAVGVRDFAIILLAARLGLRSIEVARLQLDDIDWRAGELVVRGKAGRQDRLPLPSEVGDALVAYLSGGRNPEGARHLFLTCRAPRGPIRADLVGDVVERACKRAGLPHVGPHRLRHALAGALLAQGAGLGAISQVLRHQDLATTALYAKVDLSSLRRVAQPWPGTAR
jgi:site-specific recombinase XerD